MTTPTKNKNYNTDFFATTPRQQVSDELISLLHGFHDIAKQDRQRKKNIPAPYSWLK